MARHAVALAKAGDQLHEEKVIFSSVFKAPANVNSRAFYFVRF